jgi:nucleoside-diphosphate-sugar epimerase
MNSASDQKICVVTGASGFVGRQLTAYLQRHGWRVIPWSHQPGNGGVRFELGRDVAPSQWQGARALVHCAYDFKARGMAEIFETNAIGSTKLLRSARTAGVEQIVFISSLSAFPGCRSSYGKAKLLIEKEATSVGAYVIRPGLVYGDNPGGVFGRLVQQVRSSRFVPMLQGGKQTQYLIHSDDLGELVRGCLEARVPAGFEPIAAAGEQGWELRDLLTRIAETLGRPRPHFVPVPWRIVWVGLKMLEVAGFKPDFRSDSLLSLVFQDPNPSFARLHALGFRCRPFQPNRTMLSDS